jgi:KGK domain
MSDSFVLNPTDVVSIERRKSPLHASTFTVKEMVTKITNKMGTNDRGGSELDGGTLTEWAVIGLPCQVLCVGGDWQKGRVRISLEFVPDQPEELEEAVLLSPAVSGEESPLDDLRAKLNVSNE